jgi:hypothetical protein
VSRKYFWILNFNFFYFFKCIFYKTNFGDPKLGYDNTYRPKGIGASHPPAREEYALATF